MRLQSYNPCWQSQLRGFRLQSIARYDDLAIGVVWGWFPFWGASEWWRFPRDFWNANRRRHEYLRNDWWSMVRKKYRASLKVVGVFGEINSFAESEENVIFLQGNGLYGGIIIVRGRSMFVYFVGHFCPRIYVFTITKKWQLNCDEKIYKTQNYVQTNLPINLNPRTLAP